MNLILNGIMRSVRALATLAMVLITVVILIEYIETCGATQRRAGRNQSGRTHLGPHPK
jgi:hypothetical protein